MDQLGEQQKERMVEVGRATLNMSHGIKNILQTIGSGQNVMDEALDRCDIDVAKRTWNILSQNLDRIRKLSLDMLKFSKDEALILKPCHFNRLAESVVKTVLSQADERQVSITTHTDEQLQPIPLDAEKMRDVVMNLLINAIEAVEPETGQVVIRTELDKDNQQVILCVSDNGPGIEDAKKIFEPFYSTKSHIGAGLGLSIARNIVESHHGMIEAQSLDVKGAVFTVKLPLKSQ